MIGDAFRDYRKNIILGAIGVVVGLPLIVGLIAILTICVLDRADGTIATSGETREYLLHVPESYDPTKPTPLVISLHAGATWPAHQANLSRWNRLADANGFIVVYPSGTPQFLGVVRIWRTFEPGTGLDQDVAFISDLIEALRSRYNIDSSRIYADGMSNGGGMAFVLSCRLSNRIAAVGLVAPALALPDEWCADTRPMAVMAFHGDADPIVPYDGGRLGDPFNPVRPLLRGAREWVDGWATRNRCVAGPIESPVAPDARRLEYGECAQGSTVVLYTLSGGGHSWPGGKPPPEWRVGETNESVDATAELWRFYLEHPLEKPQGDSEVDRADGRPEHPRRRRGRHDRVDLAA